MEWLNKKDSFLVKDVRNLQGNFLPLILKLAKDTKKDEGFCIVQSFEPIPLYSTLSELGYEHHTEKVSDSEWKAYFYRKETLEASLPNGMDMPLKPTAMLNFNKIDAKLANIIVNFWHLIWQDEDCVLDMKTRLLLSLANGVGAGRMRQATREFIKAYSIGVSIKEFDEVFSMLVWNQGVGYFASEIGPSTLFAAYSYAKSEEEKGESKENILKNLIEKFGEKNPEVSTIFKGNH
ncbi:MAG: DUF2249 domain-containing protein [Treponema sp.]